MLQEAGLNEVFTGGLSSYSLVLMAIAHMKADPSVDLGDLLIGFFRCFGTGSTTFDYVTQAVSLRQVGFGLLVRSCCASEGWDLISGHCGCCAQQIDLGCPGGQVTSALHVTAVALWQLDLRLAWTCCAKLSCAGHLSLAGK